jgi:predicted transposase YdaD
LKEPVFERAFETARLANFSSKQRAAYEKSRLDYYSVKAVAETAREEALIEGEEKGRIEEKIAGIVSALKRGKLTMEEIAEDFKTTVEFILKIKKEYTL